jgi:hypothetical protein
VLCDEGRERLFKDDEVPILLAKSAKVLAVVFDAAKKLNRLGSDEVESAAKNS